MRIWLIGLYLVLLAGCDNAASGLRAYKRGDHAAAARLWREAAERGDRDAQYHLGLLYRDGQGVTADRQQALAWLQKSAAQGFTESELQIGLMYAQGLGVPQDYLQAKEWYLRAAAKNDAWALHNLGVMYLYGQGVAKNETTALDYLRQSADWNHAWAQRRLGEWYGARAEWVESYKWYSLSIQTGDEKAREQRRGVAARMSFQQIDQAEDWVSSWRAKTRPLWSERTAWDRFEMAMVLLGIVVNLGVTGSYTWVWILHRRQGPHWQEADRALHELAPSLPRRWLLLFRPAGTAAWTLHLLFFATILTTLLALAGGAGLDGILLPAVVLLLLHAAAIHCDRRALAKRLVHIRGAIGPG